MAFVADLHIHSRYSRATARNLDLENLHLWALKKGISVVGTGDFTHPAWIAELKDKLVPAEPGLYRLREDLAREVNRQVPPACAGGGRFLLSVEISSIYKRDGATRKVHNVVFMPDLDAAARFGERLARIGNIASDGRPILGLDSRDLLEITLEVSEEGFLIPAHIWTPWFSMLGSKSGFDSIEECFGGLSQHIFALETGLSSDPPMNWRVSALDGRTLVSNSDAHSPAKLGREANLFNSAMDYFSMREALKTGDPEKFHGTIEFFPEEGKYHLDGHRKCGVRLSPEETREHGGRCPVCGKPVTVGVLYRVEELADRPEGEKPPTAHPFVSLIPLTDLLSEILGVGPASKKVQAALSAVLETLGPEIHVLKDLPVEAIEKGPVPFLGEAVRRMREGNVRLLGGFDGEFGVVKAFDEGELDELAGERALFDMPGPGTPAKRSRKKAKKPEAPPKPPAPRFGEAAILPTGPNPEQEAAVNAPAGPLLIVAGPGTGKTWTLTRRIARTVNEGADPASILAVTFTNRAAREMRERLAGLLPGPDAAPKMTVSTFHALGYLILKETAEREGREPPRVITGEERPYFVQAALARAGMESEDPAEAGQALARAKEALWIPADPDPPVDPALFAAYQDILDENNLADYEGLLYRPVRLLESRPGLRKELQDRFSHVFVDEYQDINLAQYRLLKALCPEGHDLTVIGDPDQAIYGFRGSDVRYFTRFRDETPGARVVNLHRNYRSADVILAASESLLEGKRLHAPEKPLRSGLVGADHVLVLECPSHAAEAETIVHRIEDMVGGTSLFSVDSGRVSDEDHGRDWSFGDFAVLFRVKAAARALMEALDRAGIPYQAPDRTKVARSPAARELTSLLRFVCGSAADPDILALLSRGGIPKAGREALLAFARSRNQSLTRALADVKRLPVPGLGRNHQSALVGLIKDAEAMATEFSGLPVSQILSEMALKTGLSETLQKDSAARDAVGALVAAAEPHGADAVGFLTERALASDTDGYDEKADRVALMTLHAAKGLEFPCVFIAGAEEGLLPFTGPVSDPADPDEERRLLYVGMTRARHTLVLTRAKSRVLYGQKSKPGPSPFLADLPEDLVRKEKSKAVKRKPKAPVQMDLFGE